MRIVVNRKSQSSANTLIVTVIFGALIALILSSTLQLITARTRIRARSLSWNQAIPVLEAGMEEGLSHIHSDSANMTTNSWTKVGSGSTVTYQKTRTNSDGSYYTVTVSNVLNSAALNPIIYSQGFVPADLKAGFISRTVQGWFTNPITFTKAVASKGTISLSGSASIDSFNSGNTNYSTNGHYDITKRRSNGNVSTSSSAHPAVTVSTGHIYGHVTTAPGGTINNGGSIGDLTWPSGTEAGWTNDDFNFSYPDNSAPSGYSNWNSVVSGTYTNAGTNYTYMLANTNYYYSGNFSVSGGQKMVVTGNVSFYVNGTFTESGSAFIYIAPGGSLTLYGGGASTTFSGGGIVNGTGLASNFSYIGMTNNTTITVSGSAEFIGTINAPEAALTDSGSGAISGAIIVNAFSDTGGAVVHYDEALSGAASAVVLAYKEL